MGKFQSLTLMNGKQSHTVKFVTLYGTVLHIVLPFVDYGV